MSRAEPPGESGRPAISVAREGNAIVLTFEGILQSSTEVTGPYTNVLRFNSPLVLTPASQQQFFRATLLPLRLEPTAPSDVYDADKIQQLILQAESPGGEIISTKAFLADAAGANRLMLPSNFEAGKLQGELDIATIPAGFYVVGLQFEYPGENFLLITKSIQIQGGDAAPFFVTPEEESVLTEDTRLTVDQVFGTGSWQSVEFAYTTDGIQWRAIATDSSMENGWSVMWPLQDVPPGGYLVRARVTTAGATHDIFRTVSRVLSGYMMEPVPVGPVQMARFIDGEDLGATEPIPISSTGPTMLPRLHGSVVLEVNADLLPAQPAGRLRASLVAKPIGRDDQTYMSSAEGDVSRPIRVPLYGLEKGDYDLVAHVFYSDGKRSYDFRTALHRVMAEQDAPMLLDKPDDHVVLFEHSVLPEFRHSQSLSIDAHTRSGEPVSFHAGWRFNSGEADRVGALPPVIAADLEGTMIDLLFSNKTDQVLTDVLDVQFFTWTEQGQPRIVQEATREIQIPPRNLAEMRLQVPVAFGSPDFMAMQVQFKESQAVFSLAGMALRGETTQLISLAGLEFGLGRWLFSPVETIDNIQFNMGYPEYHWLRCQRVKNVINPAPPPGSLVVWKIVNADGSTWSSRGREIMKHASIVGGPHHVRAEVTQPNGTVIEYGSEHWVHESQTSLDVTTTSTNTVREFGKPLEFFGPGPLKSTKTKSVSVKATVSVTTTVSGTIGNEVTGKVSAQTGVTAGVEVQRNTTDTIEIQLGQGECKQLYEVLVFQVKRGTFVKVFNDGTRIEGTWETKELTGAGTYLQTVECPPPPE